MPGSSEALRHTVQSCPALTGGRVASCLKTFSPICTLLHLLPVYPSHSLIQIIMFIYLVAISVSLMEDKFHGAGNLVYLVL